MKGLSARTRPRTATVLVKALGWVRRPVQQAGGNAAITAWQTMGNGGGSTAAAAAPAAASTGPGAPSDLTFDCAGLQACAQVFFFGAALLRARPRGPRPEEGGAARQDEHCSHLHGFQRTMGLSEAPSAPTGKRREPTGRAVLAPVNPALHGLPLAGDEPLQHTNEHHGSTLASSTNWREYIRQGQPAPWQLVPHGGRPITACRCCLASRRCQQARRQPGRQSL